MKGGFGCSPCCGPQNPCPECTHFSVTDFFDGSTVSITVDGTAVPASSSSPLIRTPPAIVRSACFLVSDTVRQARFWYEYLAGSFTEDVVDENGCNATQVYANLFMQLRFISGECTYTFKVVPYRTTGACSDTGGDAVVPSWVAVGSDCGGGIPEDCRIEALDWLSTLTVAASFSYSACECPP